MANASSEPIEFGKYQILDRIASGGMAEIFKARIEGIGGFHRTLAIKRVLPHLSANPEFIDMLVDEAKIAGLLSHANIVQILDLGAIDGQYYIAMEYVEGRDLGKLLERCAQKGITLPVPHAVYVLLEMLKGLEYAHQRQVQRGGKPVPLNIVHRDVSPGNILISFQGEVKLTDFGIAKASVKALETMAGVVKGRFDYMSPEQASALPVDARSDLFSAGVVFYQLLTGKHPFRRQGELATIETVKRGQYEPPSNVNPDIPPALEAALERALQVNPDERFPTATAFKEVLDRFFHDSGFIFSASTLGAFVRGLFPESDPKAAKNVPSRSTFRPLGGDNKPAGVQDVGALLQNLPVAPAGDAPAGFGDESTIIRPSPMANASAWAEAETIIRPDALRHMEEEQAATVPLRSATAEAQAVAAHMAANAPVEPDGDGSPRRPERTVPPPAPAIPRARTDAPTVEMSALGVDPITGQPRYGGAAARASADTIIQPAPPVPPPGATARPGSPPQRKAPTVVYRTPSHVHVVYVLVGFSALALGLLVGALLASTRTGAGGEPMQVRGDPVLEIHFPDNAKVSVAGRPVPGGSPVTTRVSPNKPTVVQVAAPDRDPIETTVTLDYNQMRVLAFTPVDLKPKDP